MRDLRTTTAGYPPARNLPDLLTPLEHKAMEVTAELWDTLQLIAGNGQARREDLGELNAYVHAIQGAILSQAAARAYPQYYRLLGCATVGVLADAAAAT